MIIQTGTRTAVLFSLLAASVVGACKSAADDEEAQIGNAVGDVMSGVDDANQGSTSTAMLDRLPVLRMPDQLRGPLWRRATEALLPEAHAAACSGVTFSSCDAGVRSRSFDDCSFGVATVSGSTSLAFSSAPACIFISTGDAVTRTASLTLTGLYGGTLAITSPGGGQVLTKTATGFEYTVPGMERVLTTAGGRELFDVSTATTAPIEITGSSRSDLVIVSGTLQITHHLDGYAVSLTASNLAWAPTCNCAVSGSLTGTVSGGKHDGKSASVTLTGCGEAEVNIDGETASVSLDRCSSI